VAEIVNQKITAMRDTQVYEKRKTTGKRIAMAGRNAVSQSLQLNIIPFSHPTKTLACGFYKEKREGTFPLRKYEYPVSLWESYEEALQDCQRLYSSFTKPDDADFETTIDLTESTRFAKHYYSQLIYNYFEDKVDAIRKNFVKDIQLWFRDSSFSEEDFTAYQKFTIKVQFSGITKSPGLLISYDGVSKVANKSLAEINVPAESLATIKYGNQIQKYSRITEDAKQNLSEVFPILSPPLRDILQIPQNVPRRENKYKPYFKKINQFYGKYLNTEEFLKIIPLSGKGFYTLPDNDAYRTHYHSNNLRFYNGTDIDPYKGIQNKGPYQTAQNPKNIRFIFIYHKPDKTGAVKQLYEYFEKGYFKNGRQVFKPLKEIIKQPFYIDKGTSIAFTDTTTAITEIKQHLIHLNKRPNTQYVAIYISPVKKDETDQDRIMLYYKVKEELLKHDITSQVIYKQNIYNNSFNYYLPNIAIALLAKIGGIPWRLDRELTEELIVGVGAFRSLTMKSRYVGSAFCFNNKGEFQGFDCFRQNEMDLLAAAIGKQILKYVVDNGEDAKRLIIHYYKPISKDELDPIQKMLGKLNLQIPVVVVTINKTESSDYVAFDTNNENLLPLSGTIIPITRSKYLLFNNTRYSENGYPPKDNPFPVKLNLFCTEKNYFEDPQVKKEIIDQVYQFSRMYWKSVKQQNLPVTIKYPEMVAQIFPFFEGDKLPDFGKNNLWFL